MAPELVWLLISLGLLVGLSLIGSWVKDRRR